MFSAATLAKLGLQPVAMQEGISGVGGLAAAISVETQIRFMHENAGIVMFRGQYAAITDLEALDISVLGRDIIGLFAVIVDRSPRCRLSAGAAASLHNPARLKTLTVAFSDFTFP